MLNALAAYYRWNIEQINVVIAYLNSNIDVILYIEALTGYKIVGKVYVLRKTIHKLKQLARQWSKNLNRRIIKTGLKRLMSDYLAFVKNLGTSKVVIIVVYIENFPFFGPDPTEINIVKFFLAKQYKMKDLRAWWQFTGIKLKRNLKTKSIFLFQRVYIEKVLKHADCKSEKPIL